jgi:hypothetical protein
MWYGITLLGGLIVLFVAIILLRDRIAFLKKGSVVTASVVRIEEKRDLDGDKFFTPVFKFITHQNEKITFRSSISNSDKNWDIGEDVRVIYNTNDPHKVVVLTYFGAFGVIIILVTIALAMLCIGGGYYIAQYYLNQF